MTTTATSPSLSDSLSPCNAAALNRVVTAEGKAEERKRRRRVDPAKRKRVAVACESCKRRKQRCDGQEPCSICTRRGFACRFQSDQEQAGISSHQPSTSPSRPITQQSLQHISAAVAQDDGMDSRLCVRTPPVSSSATAGDEVVAVGDWKSQLLCDPRGRLRFIGESGAHSFLEQVRHLFRQTAGESAFTLDVDRYNMVDGPSHHASERTLQLPSRALAGELMDIFELRVQPFSYVFHMDDFRRMVDETYQSPVDCPRNWLCLIQLAFALTSVYKPEVDSGKYFESALGLCQDSVEDGDFWMVQAYLLISLYYQLICKRNAFWIATGMAIRFAQALGFHRECVNQSLPPRERLLRRRLWRTLYIHDRFHSAALGRPSAIKDGDWDDRESSDNAEEDRLQVEMTQIAHILGDICDEVYRRRTISSQAASTLARRLQQWSDNLPGNLSLHSLLRNKSLPSWSRHALMRLHMAHLNAVILLSRPFFFFVVATAVTSQTPSSLPPRGNARGTIARLARACVLAASRSVEMVQTLFVDNARPARPPFLIYFMFLAGLILLLEAYRDKSFLRNPSITSVKIIMRAYVDLDPSAKRFYHIFEDMETAIRDDHEKRETLQARDILGELLSGNSMIGNPSLPNSVSGTSPEDLGLAQFMLDSSLLNPSMEGDGFNFDFDNISYWESMVAGGWDSGGMLFNPEL